LAYVFLVEISILILVGAGISFSRICDRFGIKKKTHEYTKAVFGYTIDIFPFSQTFIASMSDLNKYL
jgi:hypothetical protein